MWGQTVTLPFYLSFRLGFFTNGCSIPKANSCCDVGYSYI